MSEFKNVPQQYLQSQPNKHSGQPSQIIPISPNKQFTIGRSHQNSLQVLDNTISKKHAKISLRNGAYFLEDLMSANGVYLNGHKIETTVKLEHEDSIQFGKYPCLYLFIDRNNTRNKSKGKGKINLKDYLFQDNSSSQNVAKASPIDAMESAITQPISRNLPPPSQLAPKKKAKPKQSKLRIPDLSDYLKLAGGDNESYQNPTMPKSQVSPDQKYTRHIQKNAARQAKIKLRSLEEQDLTEEDLKQFKLEKRQRNIYLQQQQALQKIEREKRKAEEDKLKKELEQAKLSEDLLQKELILQQKVREEQEKVQAEKRRLEQEFVRRQQVKREEQLAKVKQLEEKERQMMVKIEQERNKQLLELKNKEEAIRQQSENQYKSEYERRKKELEVEAQALARQYENIYRETIKKVRTQIDNEELTIQKLQQKEDELQKQSQKLIEQISNLRQQINLAQNNFVKISGRNKACVLYASDIQDKIDALSSNRRQGYTQTVQTSKTAAYKKLTQSILNGRKLLKIKQKQHQSAMQELATLSLAFKEKEFASSSDVTDFIDTISENMIAIQRLKQEYMEMIESERTVEEIWEAELQENSDLQAKNRLLENEIEKNKREIEENSRDYIKKSTQQRLHMLKLMHFCPEQKKKAAKFLIEEMLNIEQQIHSFRINNEDIHKKIGKVIAQTERIRRENEYLSEILFSQDENGHHFDNMKVVINNLMDKISDEKNVDNITDCLRLSNEALKYELLVQEELQRKKKLRENMRKIGEMGLAPQSKMSEKNPLIFFGDVLTSKQISLERTKNSLSKLQSEVSNVKGEIRLLEQKKQKISQALQSYKSQQLSQARKYLGNK